MPLSNCHLSTFKNFCWKGCRSGRRLQNIPTTPSSPTTEPQLIRYFEIIFSTRFVTLRNDKCLAFIKPFLSRGRDISVRQPSRILFPSLSGFLPVESNQPRKCVQVETEGVRKSKKLTCSRGKSRFDHPENRDGDLHAWRNKVSSSRTILKCFILTGPTVN